MGLVCDTGFVGFVFCGFTLSLDLGFMVVYVLAWILLFDLLWLLKVLGFYVFTVVECWPYEFCWWVFVWFWFSGFACFVLVWVETTCFIWIVVLFYVSGESTFLVDLDLLLYFCLLCVEFVGFVIFVFCGYTWLIHVSLMVVFMCLLVCIDLSLSFEFVCCDCFLIFLTYVC